MIGRRILRNQLAAAVAWVLCASATVAWGQVHHARPWAANVVVPQALSATASRGAAIRVSEVNVGVVVVEQVATTTMDISLVNTTSARQMAEIVMPVPDGAAERTFAFQGSSSESSAELLDKDAARQTFQSIVRKMKDPALMELAGYNLIRTSVFPVEPNGEQKVRLTYEHLLTAEGNRVDYELPRSQSVSYDTQWKIAVRIKARRPIATVYSPSHNIETSRTGDNVVAVKLSEMSEKEPGSFRVSYLMEEGPVSGSLMAFPDDTGKGGYFLLLASVGKPNRDGTDKEALRRELTLVLDRSGSMSGEKFEQARTAALQVLEGLEPGEEFNVITYSDSIDLFAEKPVTKDEKTMAAAREYLAGITARGGTNIHDALLEALRPEPAKDALSIVLFLTDGLPTVGQTSEVAIREAVEKNNPHERRVFTFGVGVDVNTPLLDKLARETRATSTFVLPGEDIELKVARVFKGLDGPVLAGAKLATVDEHGEPQHGRVSELLPGVLPDFFADDQLVLLGRYTGSEPLHFALSGNYLGRERRFQLDFPLDGATRRNAFVPRLWASRKIAMLTDEIRDMGAADVSAEAAKSNPRLKELIDSIVALSTEFGILTEYTAFLALEGTDLNDRDDVLAEARRNFEGRAIGTRTGYGSANQELNNSYQRVQGCVNLTNGYWNAEMQRVAITTVQQVSDHALYRRGGRWVDSRFAADEKVEPSRTVDFGSPEFFRLVERLAGEGRQTCAALEGEILIQVDGKPVLIRGAALPTTEETVQQ